MPPFRLSRISSKDSRSSTTKRVTFIDDEDVDNVEVFANKDDIWFGRCEEGCFKQRDVKMGLLLQAMSPTELEIKTGESPRGLEHASGDYRNALLQRRRSSLAAVMSTQSLFRSQGKDGSDHIARCYALVSEKATRGAIERAEHDEKFVADQVRLAVPKNRVFEKRMDRPSVMGRQVARRSLETMVLTASSA